MSTKYMFAVFLGSRLDNYIGLASKQYETESFFFNMMTPVSVFLTSLLETDNTGLSLGRLAGTEKNHFLDSTFSKRFFILLISFFNLSTVFPIVSLSFDIDATVFVMVVMVV